MRKAKLDKKWIQVGNVRGKPIMFHPFAPRSRAIHLVDIAHALSNLCRYTGHVNNFYSVAEHCVRVSWRAEEICSSEGGDPEECMGVARQGLFHDAAEAYLGDVATPVKHQEAFAAYRAAEDHLLRKILRKFKLPETLFHEIKQADTDLLWTEVRDLMKPVHREWYKWQTVKRGKALKNQTIVGWTPRQAEKMFMQRFEALWSFSR